MKRLLSASVAATTLAFALAGCTPAPTPTTAAPGQGSAAAVTWTVGEVQAAYLTPKDSDSAGTIRAASTYVSDFASFGYEPKTLPPGVSESCAAAYNPQAAVLAQVDPTLKGRVDGPNWKSTADTSFVDTWGYVLSTAKDADASWKLIHDGITSDRCLSTAVYAAVIDANPAELTGKTSRVITRQSINCGPTDCVAFTLTRTEDKLTGWTVVARTGNVIVHFNGYAHSPGGRTAIKQIIEKQLGQLHHSG